MQMLEVTCPPQVRVFHVFSVSAIVLHIVGQRKYEYDSLYGGDVLCKSRRARGTRSHKRVVVQMRTYD
jgi:hypothetical protein